MQAISLSQASILNLSFIYDTRDWVRNCYWTMSPVNDLIFQELQSCCQFYGRGEVGLQKTDTCACYKSLENVPDGCFRICSVSHVVLISRLCWEAVLCLVIDDHSQWSSRGPGMPELEPRPLNQECFYSLNDKHKNRKDESKHLQGEFGSISGFMEVQGGFWHHHTTLS